MFMSEIHAQLFSGERNIEIGSGINIFLQIHEQKNRQALALQSEKQTKQCKFWLHL